MHQDISFGNQSHNFFGSIYLHWNAFTEFFWTYFGVSLLAGSGLHTFVLYLGPHIALFTIKAIQCGRVDIKSAPYDTIQLKRGPSWLGKDCAEFGPPLFLSSHGAQIPLSSILPQVQLEAILWGLGTALGELPPYFISRAGITCHVFFCMDTSNKVVYPFLTRVVSC